MRIEAIEEEVYSIIAILKQEDSKKNIAKATKILLKISKGLDVIHKGLQKHLASNKASPSAYLAVYHGIMQANRLFELETLLKEILGVKQKSEERIEATKKAKRPRLPIRLSGDRYRHRQQKVIPQQLMLF